VAGALLFLTVTTVAAAQINFGGWNLVIAMAIAACKALLVAAFFMHLKYDNKVYSVVFGGSFLFLSVFIVLTMFDTLNRGQIDSITARPIAQFARIYDESGRPLGKQARAEAVEIGQLSAFEMKHGLGPIKEEIKLAPLDLSLAVTGQAIFDMKCATCHKLDERYTGPALRNVVNRRSPEFILNQILNPDENVKRHPEGKKLLAEYLTFMTFQNVTKQDALTLLEYLRAANENKEPM
jgi:caa(3)-type oxidase subunit IV